MTADSTRRGYIHIPAEDVTESRVLTPDQQRAAALLEYATTGCPIARMTLAHFAHVDRVVAQLAHMGVPPVLAQDATNGASE